MYVCIYFYICLFIYASLHTYIHRYIHTHGHMSLQQPTYHAQRGKGYFEVASGFGAFQNPTIPRIAEIPPRQGTCLFPETPISLNDYTLNVSRDPTII